MDPDSLSKAAEKACSKIDEQGAFISSITIWEIGIKIKKGTLNINEDLNSFINRLKLLPIEIVPVDGNGDNIRPQNPAGIIFGH